MSWAAVGAAAISLGSTYLSSKAASDAGGGGGGAGSGGGQTVNKEPWAAAAPWLSSNLAAGQTLQNHYAVNPFTPTQQRAYGQQFANSDYMRQIMNSVLGQSGQRQPFNRGNPGAVPMPFRLPSPTATHENMGLGSSYAPMASMFAGLPQAQVPFPRQAQPQAQQLTPEQLAELNSRLKGISSSDSSWREFGDADGE